MFPWKLLERLLGLLWGATFWDYFLGRLFRLLFFWLLLGRLFGIPFFFKALESYVMGCNGKVLHTLRRRRAGPIAILLKRYMSKPWKLFLFGATFWGDFLGLLFAWV